MNKMGNPVKKFALCGDRLRMGVSESSIGRGPERCLGGVDGQFRTETQPACKEGQRTGKQSIDQFSEGDVCLEPVQPHSIQAGHQEHGTYRRTGHVGREAGTGEGGAETVPVKMIEMSRRIQRKPPAPKEFKFPTVHVGHADHE